MRGRMEWFRNEYKLNGWCEFSFKPDLTALLKIITVLNYRFTWKRKTGLHAFPSLVLSLLLRSHPKLWIIFQEIIANDDGGTG